LYHQHSLKTNSLQKACLLFLCYILATADVLPHLLEIHVNCIEYKRIFFSVFPCADSEETSTFTFPAPSALFLLKLVAIAARQCATESLLQAPGSLDNPTSAHATAPPSRGESAADTRDGASGIEGFGAAEMELRMTDPVGVNSSTKSKSQLPPALPTGRPAINILGLSLQMLSAICASREFGPPAIGGQEDAILALLNGGLVSILLDLLRALGLPDRLRGKGGPRRGASEGQSATRGNGKINEVSEGNGSKVAPSEGGTGQLTGDGEPSGGVSSKTIPSSSHPPILDEASQPRTSRLPDAYPDRSPYLGYRRDVVAVLANAAHRNPRVQDAVREGGGLLLILQQCVVEDANPYLREWGLFAVRNLCEGNERNQEEIAGLEVWGGANTEETERMGFRVEVDGGKPRLVNIAAGEI
jgi:hypothetical protein